MSFTVDEVRYLADSRDEIRAAGAGLALDGGSAFEAHAKLRTQFGPFARAVAELISAQRSADGKFPPHWLADSDAVQQATPYRVADIRVERLSRVGVEVVHDVTCSVGSEAQAADAVGLEWIGSDLDRARLLMARFNLGPGARLAQADALAPAITFGSRRGAVVADPARRAGGRRITDPARLSPPLPALLDAHRGTEMAIKCAPGIDYSEWEGLVSVVSLRGGVKEACLYSPGLSEGLTREAVVLHAEGEERVTSRDDGSVEVSPPGSFIIDPDGAVIRAGLVRQWGHRHGLSMLDDHIAYLTGEKIPPGYSGFPFIEAVPLKRLRAALAGLGAGALEILVRGVGVDPDDMRKKLKTKGDRPMAVVIARVGERAVAHICGARVWG
ncbi:hypothetical protein CAPI_06415 [Corynebacterium capitovis DSM 44611]|uniref:THUMP-like domain-containing protein n=1 Tax=Corynebacterium capitovis TaxID=131081 RepID=UPI00036F894B|nr:hypothetical protein [Corynebacterium capitovis]WKD57824.1 hypothetical protein CAPI_06415 [Corynebacterium capitovis DSM 44611]